MNIEDLLPAGMSIEDLIVVLSAVSVLAVITLLYIAMLPASPSIKRTKALLEQRRTLRAGMVGPQRRQDDRLQTLGTMYKVVKQFKLLKSAQAEKVALKLAQAGWRSNDAVVRFFFFKLSLPFVFGATALILFYGLDAYNLEGSSKVLACLAAVVGGAYAPEVYVKNTAGKRQKAIKNALPDALDLMVICAEAGLSLDATLARVSEEMETNTPEIADEFSLTGLELGFLPDRREALKNLSKRIDLFQVRGMCNSLMQAERYGTPLAQSLRVMAAESREERMLKAEEKAARLPALMTVPMIIFILPPLFVVLLGPAGLSIADQFVGAF